MVFHALDVSRRPNWGGSLNNTGWELIPSALNEYPDEIYYFKIVQFSSVFNRKYQINRYSVQAYQICEELVPGFSFLLTEKYQTIGQTIENLFQKRGILIEKCRNQTLNGCLFTILAEKPGDSGGLPPDEILGRRPKSKSSDEI